MSEWESIKLEVVTPMFMRRNSTSLPELRVPSMRGTFRYWLRFLVGGIVGNDLDSLGEVEESVFGSTDTTSPIQLRIKTKITRQNISKITFDRRDAENNGINYLLGQELAATVDKDDRGFRRLVPGASYIAPGTQFDLLVRRSPRASDDIWFLATAAIWTALECGGFGARSSRGWGSVKSLEGSTLLFPTWESRSAQDPPTTGNLGMGRLPGSIFTEGGKEYLANHVEEVLGKSFQGPQELKQKQPSYPASTEGFFEVSLGEKLPGGWQQAQEKLGQILSGVNRDAAKGDRRALGLPRYKGEGGRWPSQLKFKIHQGSDNALYPLTVVTKQQLLAPIGGSGPLVPWGFSEKSVDRVADAWFKKVGRFKETNPTL